MENKIGRIWVSLAILILAIVIWVQGDALKAMDTKPGGAPFLIALTQLGVLYIVALFVERALEVLIKVWRQEGRIRIEQQRGTAADGDSTTDTGRLEEYKAGTQRRALLVGLTLGILVSVSGVRLLAPIFQFDGTTGWTLQQAVFHFTDILLTAGLIAGGSSSIHELMALIDDFLKASRKSAKES